MVRKRTTVRATTDYELVHVIVERISGICERVRIIADSAERQDIGRISVTIQNSHIQESDLLNLKITEDDLMKKKRREEKGGAARVCRWLTNLRSEGPMSSNNSAPETNSCKLPSFG
jgi:hypothetical protein